MSKVFISYSRNDFDMAVMFASALKTDYHIPFMDQFDMPIGKWEEQIWKKIIDCDYFLLLLTKNALHSRYVYDEVKLALTLPKYQNRIVIFSAHGIGEIEAAAKESPISWNEVTNDQTQGVLDKLLEFHIELLDLNIEIPRKPEKDKDKIQNEIIQTQISNKIRGKIPRPDIEFSCYGKIRFPLCIITDGANKLEIKKGDIHCFGPGELSGDIHNDTRFLPDKEYKRWIETTVENPLAQKKNDAKVKNQLFINGEQVRLKHYDMFSDKYKLELELEWTNYYATFLTNLSTDLPLPFANDEKVWQVYQKPLRQLNQCQLSNPIAVNLSIISDNHIFFSYRGSSSAWNIQDGIQPAVSAGAKYIDLDKDGNYDPFLHAARSVREEVTAQEILPDSITFFGLARTCKTRFPFLFGEVQINLPKAVLEANRFRMGTPVGIPFTKDGVLAWLKKCYYDQWYGGIGPVIGTTIFSILESCRHHFPQDEWNDLLRQLDEL